MTAFTAEDIISRHGRVACRAVQLSLGQARFLLGFGLCLGTRGLTVSGFLAGLLLGLQASFLLCLQCSSALLGSTLSRLRFGLGLGLSHKSGFFYGLSEF